MEAHVMEELFNICVNKPLDPGHTISHETANECVARGYAKREDGAFVPTELGVDILFAWVSRSDLENPQP